MKTPIRSLYLFFWLLMFIPTVGCASLANRDDLKIPHRDQLYVSVFIDETEKGEVGLALTDEIRRKVYSRAPEKLAMFFDANAVVVDGTVLKLFEESVAPNAYQLEIMIEARLIAKDGTEVANLGRFSDKKSYRLERDVRRTGLNRQKAISLVIASLADQLIHRVHLAGQSETKKEAAMLDRHTYRSMISVCGTIIREPDESNLGAQQ